MAIIRVKARAGVGGRARAGVRGRARVRVIALVHGDPVFCKDDAQGWRILNTGLDFHKRVLINGRCFCGKSK
jgi:hypothetical protein